jgi:hypothetical protein
VIRGWGASVFTKTVHRIIAAALHTEESWKPNPTPLLLVPLAALIALSEYLAFNRIFQVDELQYVYTARLLATGDAGTYAASANLMLLGPMTWIAGLINTSALLLRTERLLFFAVFWVNLCLIVRCAGFRLRSRAGVAALLIVGTIAPLWDYGFEMRHETPLLTIVLVAWLFARPLAPGARRHLIAVGFLAVIGQFLAFKAFVYLVPIALFAVVAAVWEEKRSVIRSVAALIAGAVAGFGAAATMHLLAGTWSFYSSDTKAMTQTVVNAQRFSSRPLLERSATEAPLLFIFVGLAIVIALRHFNLRSAVSRESMLPELALFTGAVVAILANPTPFPYNMVLLVPQATILAMRLWPFPWLTERRVALGAVLVLHALLWGHATARHLSMSNARQTRLMATAEELTDAKQHAVLDGAGLVPTRHPPGRNWLIHTFTIRAFLDGTFPPIRAQLAEGKTPVIIPNYRISWLSIADKKYIRQHYVPLAADFLVAGSPVVPGRTEWECIVPGRYWVTKELTIDGTETRTNVVTLARGVHAIDSSAPAAVIWLGPRLDAPPMIGPGASEAVFVNWY